MKTGDSFRIDTLRMLNAALHNREIEKRGVGKNAELSDGDVIEVLSREAKKRKEAAEAFRKGSRQDLVDKELRELAIITAYLPAQLSEKELRVIVQKAIGEIGVTDAKDFGRVMGRLAKELKGRADGATLAALVKERLSTLDS